MNNSRKLSAIVLMSLLTLAGCAAHGGAKFNASELEGISDKYATVFFYRKVDLFNIRGRPVPVVANKVEIGRLLLGEYMKVLMVPGDYKIHSVTRGDTIDNVSDFNFEAGKSYFVRYRYVTAHIVQFTRFVPVPKEEALPEIMKTARNR